MKTSAFDRLGGWAAILAGVVGLAYSVSFVLLKNPFLYSLFLMFGGLHSSAALVALFGPLEAVDHSSPGSGWRSRLPAAVTGFLVNPIWYIWLGLTLERGRVTSASATVGA
jgi:hypothetical protein